MPIYEYCCKRCGKVSEKFVRASQEEESLSCAFCGHEGLERQFSCFSSGSISTGGASTQDKGCRPSSGFR